MREVADHAGVNRGLVYHYFGSRRDLLRSALRHNVRERIAAIRLPDRPMRFGARLRHVLRGSVRYSSALRLAVLLLLDGDTRLRLMPDLERTQELFRRDQEEGLLAPDVDPVALHATVQSLTTGYVLTRTRLAKEFGVGVRELDDRARPPPLRRPLHHRRSPPQLRPYTRLSTFSVPLRTFRAPR
ncbi:TetR family transcriptional regulator [Streptomyces sp. YC537]|uniref:TetR family transcriptional regulator n=1 Tax=Streptomyces boluensis TaxID=1775135 RepID=A0A964UVT2_9ACTN|nr:TetR family transcriptional regulator [Streptomyces boluensis]